MLLLRGYDISCLHKIESNTIGQEHLHISFNLGADSPFTFQNSNEQAKKARWLPEFSVYEVYPGLVHQ